MIREMVGLKTVASMLGGRRKRKAMTTTMVGVVGTAVGLGAVYVMRKNRNMDNDI